MYVNAYTYLFLWFPTNRLGIPRILWYIYMYSINSNLNWKGLHLVRIHFESFIILCQNHFRPNIRVTLNLTVDTLNALLSPFHTLNGWQAEAKQLVSPIQTIRPSNPPIQHTDYSQIHSTMMLDMYMYVFHGHYIHNIWWYI